MPVSFSHPLWLTALLLAVPLIVVWRHWPAAFPRRQRQAALAVRLALVVAIVLALAGPERSYDAGAQTLVVAADRSASTAEAQYQENDGRHVVGVRPARKDLLGVVSFGQEALVEDPPAHRPQFQGFATSPGDNFTDIESALRLAGSMAVGGTRRHVVLITDGRENIGDGVGEARVLRSERWCPGGRAALCKSLSALMSGWTLCSSPLRSCLARGRKQPPCW